MALGEAMLKLKLYKDGENRGHHSGFIKYSLQGRVRIS
jgi:hypothetical protein